MLLTSDKLGDISDFISKLKESDKVMVYEDIQGSPLYVNYANGEFKFKARSINSMPLNHIDFTIQKFYQSAQNYFESLDNRVKRLLNKGWWFSFEYFTDEQPANIKYDFIPKNGLILKGIYKGKSGKFSSDEGELNEYAELLGVDVQPYIFNDKPTEEQCDAIERFLKTDKGDLQYIFEETNFARFFYSIFNPNIKSSYLMNDGNFQDNCERIIIKFDAGKNTETMSLALLNPFYEKVSVKSDEDEQYNYVQQYSILLINFMEFLNRVDYTDYELVGTTKERTYIHLMSKLFNDFIEQYCNGNTSCISFDVPNFFRADKFRLNKEKVMNPKTYLLITTDEKVEWIFKAILGSFHKQKRHPVGIFTETTLSLFNQEVKKIEHIINKHLDIVSREHLANTGYLPLKNLLKSDNTENEILGDVDFEDMYAGADTSDKKDATIKK